MSIADLGVQLFTTILGAIIGIAASYYFFRTQQKTDFNRLRDEVLFLRGEHTEKSSMAASQLATVDANVASIIEKSSLAAARLISIDANLSSINERSDRTLAQTLMISAAVNVKDISSLVTSLEVLKSSYDRLYLETMGLSGKIVDGLRADQSVFLREVQREFSKSVDRSKSDLGVMFKNELAPLIPSVKDQSAIIEHLINLSGHAMLVMGQYHFQAVENQADKATEKTGKTVEASLDLLKKEAENGLRQIDEMPILLPRK